MNDHRSYVGIHIQFKQNSERDCRHPTVQTKGLFMWARSVTWLARLQGRISPLGSYEKVQPGLRDKKICKQFFYNITFGSRNYSCQSVKSWVRHLFSSTT